MFRVKYNNNNNNNNNNVPRPPPTAIDHTMILGAQAATTRETQAVIPPTMTTTRWPTFCTTKWFGNAVAHKRGKRTMNILLVEIVEIISFATPCGSIVLDINNMI